MECLLPLRLDDLHRPTLTRTQRGGKDQDQQGGASHRVPSERPVEAGVIAGVVSQPDFVGAVNIHHVEII